MFTAARGGSAARDIPMPPKIIDLSKTDDPRDVVHLAVQALAESRAVIFPTETDYVVAAAARRDGLEQIADFAVHRDGEPLLSLVVKSADEALDWAPRLTGVGQRIARRCWPGPVSLLVADDHPESLVHRLPESARRGVVGNAHLRLRVPGHPLLGDCLRMLDGPVAVAEPESAGQGVPVTAQECLERCGEVITLVLDDGRTRYAQAPTTIAVDSADFKVVRPGVIAEESIRRLASLMVLFVCTGNTCRSPMAEVLFRDMVAKRLGCRPDEIESHGVIVASAGIAAWAGGRASGNAVEAMEERGIDLTSHASQPLSDDLVRQADLIWTMTNSHRAAITSQFPEAAARVAVLSPDRHDVLDPIGGPLPVYRECARQIHDHLAARLATLDLDPRRG